MECHPCGLGGRGKGVTHSRVTLAITKLTHWVAIAAKGKRVCRYCIIDSLYIVTFVIVTP